MASFSNVFIASDVNSACKAFRNTFVAVLDDVIPKIRIKDPSARAWIDGDVRHLQNKNILPGDVPRN